MPEEPKSSIETLNLEIARLIKQYDEWQIVDIMLGRQPSMLRNVNQNNNNHQKPLSFEQED
jgi:hypothetical protein